MGRPGHDLRRWNSLGAPLVPVAEDDRELKISPAVSPMRGPRVGSGPDACASLTCDEGSLSESSDIVAPQVLPVTSAALRLGLLAVPEPRVPAIGAGSVNRLPGTSGTPSQRRAFDGRRAQKKPAGLGCRSYSLGSGLSMLRARRPPRSAAAKDSEYHPLMPLVLQALGRLRCVRCHAPIGVAFSFPVLPRFRARGTVFSCGVCASAVFAVETRKKTVSVSVARFSVSTTDDFSFRFVSATQTHEKKKKTRSSGGWSCVPVPELDAWFRAHSHADAVNGPPPASSSDLAAIARRFVGSQGTPPKPAARASVGECGGETESERSAVSRADSFTEEARTPTGGSRFFGFGEAVGTPSCAPETAPTSVDDLVDRAVARANAFSDAQVRAFGEACAQSRWCAVNKLSGDEVRTRSVFFRRFRSCQRSWFFGCGHFFQSRFGCGHFFLATSARATTPATRFDSRTAS